MSLVFVTNGVPIKSGKNMQILTVLSPVYMRVPSFSE